MKAKSRQRIILVVPLLFVWGVLFPQTSITGTVYDAGGQSLPGANIFLMSDWSIGTATKSDGSFKLIIPSSLITDTLIVSFVGYKEQKIALNQNQQKYIVSLTPIAHQLEESVIIGRRVVSEEFSIKQAKQLDIYLDPGSKADPLLAVNSMPSSTTVDESASVSLRGSRPEETTIFFNEVPVYDAVRFSQLDGIGTFSIFNTAIVDRMLVYPGNPPLEYGNTTSGLINIQSHNRIIEGQTSQFSLSLANIGALHSQNIKEKNALTVFANYQPDEVLAGLNESAFEDIKSFYSGDLGIHYIFDTDNKFKAKFFNYTNIEGYEFNYTHPSFDGIFDMGKNRNFSILNLSHKLKDGEINLNTGASFSTEKYVYSITDIDMQKQDYYASLNYFKAFNKLTLKLGSSYDARFQKSKGTKPMYYYAQDISHPSIAFDSDQSYQLLDLSTYLKYYITDNLISSVGLRKNIPLGDIPDFFSYQANIAYIIKQYHNLKIAAGKYNKMAMPSANRYEITHFESEQISIDYSYETNPLKINLSAFKKWSYYGDTEEDINGLEIYSKINKKKFELQASYTYLDAILKTANMEHASDYDFDYFIKATGKFKFQNFFEISAIYLFRQGQYYEPVSNAIYNPSLDTYEPIGLGWDNAERMPDFHKIDIAVSKLFFFKNDVGLTVFASMNNVLNNENVSYLNYNNDYSQSFYELYSKRSIYFGCVIFL